MADTQQSPWAVQKLEGGKVAFVLDIPVLEKWANLDLVNRIFDEIARRISETYVSTHQTSIMSKMDIDSISRAVSARIVSDFLVHLQKTK